MLLAQRWDLTSLLPMQNQAGRDAEGNLKIMMCAELNSLLFPGLFFPLCNRIVLPARNNLAAIRMAAGAHK